MELCGQSLLDEYNSRTHEYSDFELKKIACELINGVAEMHRHSKFHLDIKLTNVMRSLDGSRLKIIDFNVSQ